MIQALVSIHTLWGVNLNAFPLPSAVSSSLRHATHCERRENTWLWRHGWPQGPLLTTHWPLGLGGSMFSYYFWRWLQMTRVYIVALSHQMWYLKIHYSSSLKLPLKKELECHEPEKAPRDRARLPVSMRGTHCSPNRGQLRHETSNHGFFPLLFP